MALGSRLSALALALGGLACGQRDFTMKQLPSGHRFKILQAGKARFEKAGQTAAMLVFESDRAPGDRQGLEADIAELWEAFRPDAEKAGLDLAVIQANLVPKGMLSSERVSAAYVWRRKADGSWAREN